MLRIPKKSDGECYEQQSCLVAVSLDVGRRDPVLSVVKAPRTAVLGAGTDIRMDAGTVHTLFTFTATISIAAAQTPAAPPPPPSHLLLATEESSSNAQLVALAIGGGIIVSWTLLLAIAHTFGGGPSAASAPSRTRVSPEILTEAERVFQKIDKKGAREGEIEVAKVAAYLIKSGETNAHTAHELIMQLDADNNGKISLDEWRKGWASKLVGDGSPTDTAAPVTAVAAEPESSMTSPRFDKLTPGTPR